jgi:hypothetical protein
MIPDGLADASEVVDLIDALRAADVDRRWGRRRQPVWKQCRSRERCRRHRHRDRRLQ